MTITMWLMIRLDRRRHKLLTLTKCSIITKKAENVIFGLWCCLKSFITKNKCWAQLAFCIEITYILTSAYILSSAYILTSVSGALCWLNLCELMQRVRNHGIWCFVECDSSLSSLTTVIWTVLRSTCVQRESVALKQDGASALTFYFRFLFNFKVNFFFDKKCHIICFCWLKN